MGFFSNVKKKDEKDIKKATARPVPNPAAEAKGGGKASGKNIESLGDSFSDAQMKRMIASRNDNSWGYHDTNTGIYVPWYIDAQDGGGKNQSGDTPKARVCTVRY